MIEESARNKAENQTISVGENEISLVLTAETATSNNVSDKSVEIPTSNLCPRMKAVEKRTIYAGGNEIGMRLPTEPSASKNASDRIPTEEVLPREDMKDDVKKILREGRKEFQSSPQAVVQVCESPCAQVKSEDESARFEGDNAGQTLKQGESARKVDPVKKTPERPDVVEEIFVAVEKKMPIKLAQDDKVRRVQAFLSQVPK